MLPSPAALFRPCPPVALPPALRTDRSQPLCGIGYIAWKLGKEEIRVPALIAYLRKLITDYGFPPPVAPRLYRGEMLVGAPAVCIGARWHQLLVDCWVAGLQPVELQLVVDNDAARREADILDARAAAIGLGR